MRRMSPDSSMQQAASSSSEDDDDVQREANINSIAIGVTETPTFQNYAFQSTDNL